jgi:hypothetical protein
MTQERGGWARSRDQFAGRGAPLCFVQRRDPVGFAKALTCAFGGSSQTWPKATIFAATSFKVLAAVTPDAFLQSFNLPARFS